MQILIALSQTSFFFQIGIMLPGTQIGTLQKFYANQKLFWSVFIPVSPFI